MPCERVRPASTVKSAAVTAVAAAAAAAAVVIVALLYKLFRACTSSQLL
jgi:hypothetical protein